MVGKMIDLDKRLGFWSLRVWGLVLNLVGNALAIYGAVGLLKSSTHLAYLIIGCALTLLCILTLARPSRD